MKHKRRRLSRPMSGFVPSLRKNTFGTHASARIFQSERLHTAWRPQRTAPKATWRERRRPRPKPRQFVHDSGVQSCMTGSACSSHHQLVPRPNASDCASPLARALSRLLGALAVLRAYRKLTGVNVESRRTGEFLLRTALPSNNRFLDGRDFATGMMIAGAVAV